MSDEPRVDSFDLESFRRRSFDGHENQRREGIRRPMLDVDERIVRNVRRMRKRPRRMIMKRRRTTRCAGGSGSGGGGRSVFDGGSVDIIVVIIAVAAHSTE